MRQVHEAGATGGGCLHAGHLPVARLRRLERRARYPFIVNGVETAICKSEILLIRREHIDHQRRAIHIPKAKAGAREQPITEHLGEFLACTWTRCKRATPACSRLQARRPGTPWTCASRFAGPDPDQILRHTLRHTAITHLGQAGVDLLTVKRISGHKTLAMVERYSLQNCTHIQAAMDKLQARFKLAS